MNHLLDTCVISEYQNKAPNEAVLSWIESQAEESLYLSILTIGEIEKGIAKLPNSKKKNELLKWLQSLIYRFDKRILPIDLEIIRCWGNLVGTLETKGRILPIMDSLIAATAIDKNLTIVTRNVRDFADTGVKILNIWE